MAVFKLVPLLCTHVYSYMFSAVHPPRINHFILMVFSDIVSSESHLFFKLNLLRDNPGGCTFHNTGIHASAQKGY
jgi:hypothetical protein